MKAVRLYGRNDVRVVDIPRPEPGAGEVLIKIGAAGVCHSDLHLIEHAAPLLDVPFTLGHENAGWVVDLGPGVSGFTSGEAVIVYGAWGCGHCAACQQSQENYCEHQRSSRVLGGGLGRDGGMAEYMVVPAARLLVRLGDLLPEQAAPLTDAALTPWHAIKRSVDKISPGKTVLVLGIGGLGHMAVQMLKNISAATVIAGDVAQDKLVLAQRYGADYVVNTAQSDAAERILSITGSGQCALVLDFVGVDATLRLASEVVAINGDITVVGLSGGHLDCSSGKLPFGVRVSTPYWGSRVELMEVVEMRRQKLIDIETETFPLEEANAVYQRLREGKISGRAVLVPR